MFTVGGGRKVIGAEEAKARKSGALCPALPPTGLLGS